MDNLVIEPAKITTIKIQDTEEKFPVRRVYCIGRNYADHVIEMGNDPKEDPIFFQKNPNKLNYLYILTPKGISEKTKLTINFMKRIMKEYDELKKEVR